MTFRHPVTFPPLFMDVMALADKFGEVGAGRQAFNARATSRAILMDVKEVRILSAYLASPLHAS